ncbi:MAG: DUF2889 domain-containing protein [Actinomycetota bacterium]
MSATLPPRPEGELLHQRRYEVDAFKLDDDHLLLRGMIHDQKPPGVYIEDDPEPLSIHQMVVDLTLVFPSLEIVAAEVLMEVTPHTGCASIEPTYQQLVGVSIARGFSRTVRELFGGPRGCTHVGALLQAMAPVAIQSMWSMRMNDETAVELSTEEAQAQRREAMKFNTDTCHVWERDGELLKKALSGEDFEPPVWAVKRLEELGRSPEEWMNRGG